MKRETDERRAVEACSGEHGPEEPVVGNKWQFERELRKIKSIMKMMRQGWLGKSTGARSSGEKSPRRAGARRWQMIIKG
jgi:hypothetical protein